MTEAERRDLRDLVERYAQAVDRRDKNDLAALFADDAVVTMWLDPTSDRPTGERSGRGEIAALVDQITRYEATHHAISSHRSAVHGMTADGETFCTAHHLESVGATRHDRVLYIRYVDTFAREVEGWRFTRRDVHVQWVSVLPAS